MSWMWPWDGTTEANWHRSYGPGCRHEELKMYVDKLVCQKEKNEQINRPANHFVTLTLSVKWKSLENDQIHVGVILILYTAFVFIRCVCNVPCFCYFQKICNSFLLLCLSFVSQPYIDDWSYCCFGHIIYRQTKRTEDCIWEVHVSIKCTNLVIFQSERKSNWCAICISVRKKQFNKSNTCML